MVDDLLPMGRIDKPELAQGKVTRGMALIDFAPIVHWGREKYQKNLEAIKKEYEDEGYETVTITDNQALFVENGKRTLVE